MSFEGTLADLSGNAVDLQGQQLYYYISVPIAGEKCVLFAESSSVSGDADGAILHKFGSGSAVTSPIAFNHILNNSVFVGNANGFTESGGISCSVTANDTRYADVYSAVLSVTASITLGAAPYAQYAMDASLLNGKSDTDFILASSVSGGADGQVLSRNGSDFTWVDLPAATGGVSSIDLGSASATGTLASARLPDVVSAGTYAKVTVDSKGRVTSSSLLSASDIGSGTFPTTRGGTGMSSIGTANTLLAVNNSATGLEYKAIAGGSGVIVTTGSGAVNVSLDTFGVSGTYVKVTVDSYGRVSGGQNLSSSDVTTGLGYTPANMTTSGTACDASLTSAFRYNSGTMEFCNGSTWQALGLSGVGANPIGSAGGDLSGTYPNPTIGTGKVDSSKILDGTIANADIAAATITYSKLNLTDGDVPQSKISGLTSVLSGKEPTLTSGTASQYYRGDKTWQALNTAAVTESSNLYFTETRVRQTLLTGYADGTNSSVAVGDNFLQALGKLQGQINSRFQTNGTDLYYNNGNVAIGSSVNPANKLYVKNTNGASAVVLLEQWDDSPANLSTPVPLLTLSRRLPAGSNPASGFGSVIQFTAENSNHDLKPQASIITRWINASAGSETSQIEFSSYSGVSNTMITKLILDPDGHVGIPSGNLMVNGSLRLGGDGSNSTHNCSPSEEGKQRYNSNLKTMEYCDGANWQGMTGVTYCDSGYTLVGVSGTATAFCAQTTASATYSDYGTASTDCHYRIPSRKSQMRVCSIQQLDAICEENLLSPSGEQQWTSNSASGNQNYSATYTWTTSSCHLNYFAVGDTGRQLDISQLSTNFKYRCCYQ